VGDNHGSHGQHGALLELDRLRVFVLQINVVTNPYSFANLDAAKPMQAGANRHGARTFARERVKESVERPS
jgi:hypothetical protein